MAIIILLLAVGFYIYQQKEIKRLHECWDDVFNAKLESESKWRDLCNHYLEKIDDLLAENKLLKERVALLEAQKKLKRSPSKCAKMD